MHIYALKGSEPFPKQTLRSRERKEAPKAPPRRVRIRAVQSVQASAQGGMVLIHKTQVTCAAKDSKYPPALVHLASH